MRGGAVGGRSILLLGAASPVRLVFRRDQQQANATPTHASHSQCVSTTLQRSITRTICPRCAGDLNMGTALPADHACLRDWGVGLHAAAHGRHSPSARPQTHMSWPSTRSACLITCAGRALRPGAVKRQGVQRPHPVLRVTTNAIQGTIPPTAVCRAWATSGRLQTAVAAGPHARSPCWACCCQALRQAGRRRLRRWRCCVNRCRCHGAARCCCPTPPGRRTVAATPERARQSLHIAAPHMAVLNWVCSTWLAVDS